MKPVSFYPKIIKESILKGQKINVSAPAVPHYATGGQWDDTVTPLELNQRLRSFLVLTDIYLDTSL